MGTLGGKNVSPFSFRSHHERLDPPDSLERMWEFWESFSHVVSMSQPESSPEREEDTVRRTSENCA